MVFTDSKAMTIIGSVNAAGSFILAHLPDGTPSLAKTILGALCAGASFYLGYTNRGLTQVQKVRLPIRG